MSANGCIRTTAVSQFVHTVTMSNILLFLAETGKSQHRVLHCITWL